MTVARDWKTSQRYIRVGHNKAIRNYFQTVPTGSNRENLRNSLLMYKDDSAPQMLVKMQYFNQYLSGIKFDTVPVIPDSWQVRVGRDRPQLIVIFKPKNSSYPKPDSRWTLSIPHFDFTSSNKESQLRKIPNYEKGKHQGVYTLKDNSKIIVYAKSNLEARPFIKSIVNNGLIKREQLYESTITDDDIKVGEAKGTYQELEVTPTCAKYFSTGQKNLKPDWIEFIT